MTGAMNFTIAGLPKIIFGEGTIRQIGELCASFGGRILLVTGERSFSDTRIQSILEESLHARHLTWYRYIVAGEPSPSIVDTAVREYKGKHIRSVVAVGGGSVLDAGKAIAAMFCENGSVKDFLDDVGNKIPSGKRLPLVAVPTTAGTGSEATKNAVISELGEKGFKKSLRHDRYVPDLALIDPVLTYDCSPQQTAASGMDAFTQLLESYLSTAANPFTDALALAGLQAVASGLEKVMSDPENQKARAEMAYAALLSGITLANAGLGVIHGFAQPLGSFFPVPHGIVCGTLMGVVNRMTVARLKKMPAGMEYLSKYTLAGRLFARTQGLSDNYYVDLLLDTIDRYTIDFKIPMLSEFGVNQESLDRIVAKTGLKNHPVAFDKKDLKKILMKRI